MGWLEENMLPYYPLGVYKDKARRQIMASCETVMAGFGGQGILFAGKLLAYCGMVEEKELSWLPSYGPEMRGGTCNCHVILSDEAVSSPFITEPDVLVAMNAPSLDKFEKAVKRAALLLLTHLLSRAR